MTPPGKKIKKLHTLTYEISEKNLQSAGTLPLLVAGNGAKKPFTTVFSDKSQKTIVPAF